MQLNDVGFQITRYYHTSLGTERDRILLKRESGRLAKAVIEYLGCKCNQVGVTVACLNIAEYLVNQAVDRLEIGLLRLLDHRREHCSLTLGTLIVITGRITDTRECTCLYTIHCVGAGSRQILGFLLGQLGDLIHVAVHQHRFLIGYGHLNTAEKIHTLYHRIKVHGHIIRNI